MSRSSISTKPQMAARPADRTMEVAISPKRVPESGICVSCVHQPTCLFREAARHPIYFCEEFDDQAAQSEVAAQAKTVKAAPATPAINYGEAQELGLCANCATKTQCMNRRPGIAVWHCEDYS